MPGEAEEQSLLRKERGRRGGGGGAILLEEGCLQPARVPMSSHVGPVVHRTSPSSTYTRHMGVGVVQGRP